MRVGAAEEAGRGGTAETAADHHDTWGGLRAGDEGGGEEGGGGAQDGAAGSTPSPRPPSRKGRGRKVRAPPPLAGGGRGEGVSASLLRRPPCGDRGRLVRREALGDAVHHGGLAGSGAERVHRRDYIA